MKISSRLLLPGFLWLVFSGLTFCLPGCSGNTPDTAAPQAGEQTTPNVSATADDGDPAAETSASTPITTADLQIVDEASFAEFMKQHQGQVVFIDFWATWCPNCLDQFPHTVELHKKYADRGLVVVSVSFDEGDPATLEQVAEFLTRQQADFPALVSKYGLDDASYAMFDIDDNLPHYQLYGRDGQLLEKFIFSDPNAPAPTPEEIDARVAAALQP